MHILKRYIIPLTLVLCMAAILIGQDKPEPQWLNTDLPEQHYPTAEWTVDEACDCTTSFDSTSIKPVYEFDPERGWMIGEGKEKSEEE